MTPPAQEEKEMKSSAIIESDEVTVVKVDAKRKLRKIF